MDIITFYLFSETLLNYAYSVFLLSNSILAVSSLVYKLWEVSNYLKFKKIGCLLKKGELFLQIFFNFCALKIYIYTYLFDTTTKYQTILYYPGLYSFLTDEKWAYGGNLKIIHHKDQHFMFLKIFLQFTKLYCSSQF